MTAEKEIETIRAEIEVFSHKMAEAQIVVDSLKSEIRKRRYQIQKIESLKKP